MIGRKEGDVSFVRRRVEPFSRTDGALCGRGDFSREDWFSPSATVSPVRLIDGCGTDRRGESTIEITASCDFVDASDDCDRGWWCGGSNGGAPLGIWLDAVGTSEVDDLMSKITDLNIKKNILISYMIDLNHKVNFLTVEIIDLSYETKLLMYDDNIVTIKISVLNGEEIVLVTPFADRRVEGEKGECHGASKSSFDFLHRRRAGVDQGHPRHACAGTAPRHPVRGRRQAACSG
ncbi:MAG TPA: hypothetical protein VF713_13310, partial [Thermoanaerobaculia bacterium]